MLDIVKLDSIDAYNKLYGLRTLHPLVGVIDLRQATKSVNHVKMFYGLYALYLKGGVNCTLKYGRQKYDYQEGTIVSFAPGQVVEVDMPEDEFAPEVYGLLFHPDIIHGTSLARKMSKYSFFDYSQTESLHLSDTERSIILDCLSKIRQELEHPVDSHSRDLIVVNIEMILEYCLRFYDRQFCTRHKVNSDLLSVFEAELDNYFSSGKSMTEGLPTVAMFADKACLSKSYFSDLIRKETGSSPQELIHNKIIILSKNMLLDGKSISEVAYALGFQYSQHFSRLFKQKQGITPKEFRETFIM